MLARRLIAGTFFVLMAVLVVGNALVRAWSAQYPASAARWWPGHPEVERVMAEREIGEAAARGASPAAETFVRLETLARRAPMSLTPLFAAGAAALQSGDRKKAQRLFEIAEGRDGRDLAAHYFLADIYLRNGQVGKGLGELVDLARLAPGGISGAAPFVAQYARSRENWDQIRGALAREPQLARDVLLALAADPDNFAALSALAHGINRAPDAPWVGRALDSAIAVGRYSEAHDLWLELAGQDARPGELVHDPQFGSSRAPQPFNWSLSESSVGSAERQEGAGLHVLSYGSQSGILARQLLMLPPGKYRLQIEARGRVGEARALEWTLACANADKILASLSVAPPASSSAEIDVRGDCPAQWLALNARAQDIGGDSDVVFPSVKLTRAGR